jgi:hypothetical protein
MKGQEELNAELANLRQLLSLLKLDMQSNKA